MKKNWIRLFSLILVLAMIFSLGACSEMKTTVDSSDAESDLLLGDDDDFFTDEVTDATSDNKTKKPGKSTNPDATGSAIPVENQVGGKSWSSILKSMPASLKGKTITVMNWNPLSEYTGASQVIKDFQSATGISIRWQVENFSTYLSKLASMVASGNAPDVVRLRTPLPGGLISLQDVSVTGYDFNDDAWDKWVQNAYTVNGKVYGINVANTHIASPTMLQYNKSLISKYDLDDPYTLWKKGQWTYDNFIKICRSYKEASGADYAGSFYDYAEISSMFGISGPVTFNGSTYTNIVKTNDFVNVTQKICDLVNKDYILGKWKFDDFSKGKCLFWIGTAVYARRQNAYFTELKKANSLYSVPMPSVNGKEYTLFTELEAYGIPKGAKTPKAVPYFLRYFLDGSNYDLSTFFANAQSLQVYNACMTNKNKMWTTQYREQYQFYGLDSTDDFSGEIETVTGAQAKSVIDKTSAVIDARVSRYNQQIKKIG